MSVKTIAFIGGGNMAASITGGLIADGHPQSALWVCDPSAQSLDAIRRRWPQIHLTHNNEEASAQSQVVVLAVKPQVLQQAARGIREPVQDHRPLIISIAAGVREKDINRWLGGNLAIVRAMPNTPALVRSGATGLYANAQVSPEQHDLAESILRAVGITLWLEREELLDAVTAVSGSGPAYFFYVMEAMEAAGITLGLTPQTARLLVLETAFGAAKLGLESQDDAATLRQRVTSKGGTTARALEIMEQRGLHEIFEQALRAAAQRAHELANELGDDDT